MKITYLGTAATEGFPALFCNCKYCKEGRELGGKNIRTRSQALINDDLLIDFPADTYSHFLQNGIEGDKIKYLFITHSHSDHFYTNDLFIRSGVFAHDMRTPTLKMFCSQVTYKKSQCPIPHTISKNGLTKSETFYTIYAIKRLSRNQYPFVCVSENCCLVRNSNADVGKFLLQAVG